VHLNHRPALAGSIAGQSGIAPMGLVINSQNLCLPRHPGGNGRHCSHCVFGKGGFAAYGFSCDAWWQRNRGGRHCVWYWQQRLTRELAAVESLTITAWQEEEPKHTDADTRQRRILAQQQQRFDAVRQAVAEKTRVAESLESLRRDLNLRVHKEYRGVTEGLLRIQALEQALRSATQLLDSTQKSQRAGVRTMLDVLNAEQQLVNVNRDLIQARYVYLMSRLRLSSLAGVDAVTSVSEINRAFNP
jgi:hypothetical protein